MPAHIPYLSAGAADRSRCGATGKIIYASKDEARAAAADPGRRRAGITRYYRCPFCQLWHLTKGIHNHGSGNSWKSA